MHPPPTSASIKRVEPSRGLIKSSVMHIGDRDNATLIQYPGNPWIIGIAVDAGGVKMQVRYVARGEFVPATCIVACVHACIGTQYINWRRSDG